MYNYIDPPKFLTGFPKAKKVKNKSRRKRWVLPDGSILEWDYQHGRIEKYNDRGDHLGEFDHENGKQTKPAEKTRKITPTIKRATTMKFALTWYEKTGENYLGERELPTTTEEEVRNVFNIQEDEYAGFCHQVEESNLNWLKPLTPDLILMLDKFDYFVEPYAD